MSGTQAGRQRAPRPGGATANGRSYERYKDALRRGHVAALRGRNDAAVEPTGRRPRSRRIARCRTPASAGSS